MDISTIRKKIDGGGFNIVDHALTEAFKDGISVNDIIFCIKNGKIIESYPDRKRCLIFSMLNLDIPRHVVVDYSSNEIEIITAYIPDRQHGQTFKSGKRGESMKKQKPCPECHSTMELKKTTLHFEREGFYADVENVSAFICPKCATRSIPGKLAVNIGNTVEGLFKSAKEAAASTEKDIAPAFSGISFHMVRG